MPGKRIPPSSSRSSPLKCIRKTLSDVGELPQRSDQYGWEMEFSCSWGTFPRLSESQSFLMKIIEKRKNISNFLGIWNRNFSWCEIVFAEEYCEMKFLLVMSQRLSCSTFKTFCVLEFLFCVIWKSVLVMMKVWVYSTFSWEHPRVLSKQTICPTF